MTKEERVLKEKEHLENLKNFDLNITKGYILGIDEVGRGPLAGPLVVCGVIMEKESKILGVKDSKKVSEKNRTILYEKILNEAKKVEYIIVTPERIDEINILNATKEAMNKIAEKLGKEADEILVDAVEGIKGEKDAIAIIKGDDKSYSVACASIVAKVVRDRIMIELDQKYPCYDFKSNKGYGTKKHYDALLTYGKCKEHRNTFLKTLEKHKK